MIQRCASQGSLLFDEVQLAVGMARPAEIRLRGKSEKSKRAARRVWNRAEPSGLGCTLLGRSLVCLT